MRRLISAALAAVLVLASPAAAQTVSVTGGVIAGATDDGVTAYKGIPYAAAPVGENRWRAPQPVEPWSGVRDARNYGADCAQAIFPPDAAPIRTEPAEDCLFLNVWTPETAQAGDGLPVMVFIHGGGFVNGGSSPAIYSGHSFARDGVILVSFNYRLGRFGFFAHPALVEEGFGGNFGFLDQIAALEWVQANIAAFGGDPARVTIFGESAGGMSVHMALQSPLARGLFGAAIIESGGGRERAMPMPDLAGGAQAGEAFAPGLDAQALRALPEEQIVGGLNMMTTGQGGYSGPMVDGRTILGQSVDAIAAGLYADVPVIVGANSADGFPTGTDKAALFAGFGEDEAEARTLYDPDGTAGGLQVSTMISAGPLFQEPARAVARAMAARGRQVWLYRFAHVGTNSGAEMGGAPHASELPYVFDTLAHQLDSADVPGDQQVADLVHGYWVEFARTGKPDGHGDLPAWPLATPDDTTVQLIGSEGTVHAEDPLTPQLDFVERRLVSAP